MSPLGTLANARSLDINMNLGIGPDNDGELTVRLPAARTFPMW